MSETDPRARSSSAQRARPKPPTSRSSSASRGPSPASRRPSSISRAPDDDNGPRSRSPPSSEPSSAIPENSEVGSEASLLSQGAARGLLRRRSSARMSVGESSRSPPPPNNRGSSPGLILEEPGQGDEIRPGGAKSASASVALATTLSLPGDGSSELEETINVGVRVRPIAPHEVKAGAAEAVRLDRSSGCISLHEPSRNGGSSSSGGGVEDGDGESSGHTSSRAGDGGGRDEFKFNFVYPSDVETFEVYDDLVNPILNHLFLGYNGTVLCYGQTGSGKTYTVSGTAHDPGIVPIAVNELFHLITERRSTEAFKVSLGYLEIYNERIYDLCSPSLNGQDGKDSGGKSSSSGKDNSKDSGRLSKELPLYEDARLGTCVRGLTSQTVTSPEQVLHALAVAQSSRSMAATAMNLNSSRSHTITRLVVEASAVGVTGATRVCMLNLVDLAGSERASKTRATGNTLREGAFINKSLLTLSTVIAELSKGKDRAGHVPYRDSKLTRLLQTSLGGNARTALVCNVSPAGNQLVETRSTLMFGQRAATIVNKAVAGSTMDTATLLAAYQVELLKLKASHSHLEAVVKLVADQEVTIEATSNNEEAPANSTRPALKGKTATGAAAASSSALALKGNNNSSSSGNSEPLVLRPLGILAAADENPAAAQALLRSLHGLALGAQAPALAWLCNQAAVLGQPPPADAAAALAAYSASNAASSSAVANAATSQKLKSKSGRPGATSSKSGESSTCESGSGKSGPALRGRKRAPGVGTVAASVFPAAAPEEEEEEGDRSEDDEESEEEEEEEEETEAERSLRMLLGGSDEKGNRRRPPPPPKRQKSKRLAMSSKLMAEMQLLEEAAAAQTAAAEAAAAAAAATAESGSSADGGDGKDDEDLGHSGGATLSDLGDAVALLEGGREALSRLLEVVGSLAGNANAEGLETEAEAAEAALDAAVMLLEEVSETAALENWGPQLSANNASSSAPVAANAIMAAPAADDVDDGKNAALQARAEEAEARTKELEAQLTQTKAKSEAAEKEKNEAVARAEAAEATLVKAEARAEVAEAHMHQAETRAEAAEAKITQSDANSETAAEAQTAREKEMALLVAALQEIDAAALSKLGKKAVAKGAQGATIMEGSLPEEKEGEDEDDEDGLGLGSKRGLGEETASEEEDEEEEVDEYDDDDDEAHPWLDGSRVPGAASELQVKLLRRRSVVSPRKPPNLSSLMRQRGAPSGPAALAKRAVSRSHLLAARVEALEAAVASAQTSAKSAQSALNAAMTSAPEKDQALADALSRAEAAEASVEASKQALKASEDESADALTQQTSKAEVKIAESKAAADKAIQESTALQSQLTSLQDAQQEQSTRLTAAQDEVKTLTDALSKAKEELTASESLVASLREGHTRLFAELSSAEAEVKQARADATAAVEATAAAEAARVASAHQSASAQVADAVAATTKANADLEAARKQVATLEAEVVAKDQQLQAAADEVQVQMQAQKQLEDRLRAQKGVHQGLEKQLETSTAEMAKVRSQLEATTAAAEAAAAQHAIDLKDAQLRVAETAAAAETFATEKSAAAMADKAAVVAAEATAAAAVAEQNALSAASAAEGEALLQEVESALAAAVSIGHEASQAVTALSTIFETVDDTSADSKLSNGGADSNALSPAAAVSTVASEVRLAYAQRLTALQATLAQSRNECRRLSSLLEAALSRREDAAALHASETRRAALEKAAEEALVLTKEAENLMVEKVDKAGESAANALVENSGSGSGVARSNHENEELDLDETVEDCATVSISKKVEEEEESKPDAKKKRKQEHQQQLEACVDLSRECLYFKRKADLALALRNDAQRGLQLARRQLQTLQDYADAEHISALAVDAAPDLAIATQQLQTKLKGQAEQLDARNNELEALKVVQATSARDLANLSLDVEGLELSLRECERSRQASDGLVQQLQQRCATLTSECATLASEARQSTLRAANAQDGKDKAERVIVAAGLSFDGAAGPHSSSGDSSSSRSFAEVLKQAHARQDAAQLESQEAQRQVEEFRAQYQATQAIASQVSDSLAAARKQYEWVARTLGPSSSGSTDNSNSSSASNAGSSIANEDNGSRSGLLGQQEKLEQSVKLLADHLRRLNPSTVSNGNAKHVDASIYNNNSSNTNNNSVAGALAHARALAASERESALHRSEAESLSSKSSTSRNAKGEERGRDSSATSTGSKSKSPPALPARSRSRK